MTPPDSTDVVTLRPAEPSDADTIARLVTLLGYETDRDDMKKRLATISGEPDYLTLVAEVRGTVVGVAGGRIGPLYEKTGPSGQLMLLAVAESARGGGVGGALISAMEAWVVDQGGIEIVVHSGDQRTAAHGFYARFGYADTGRRFIKLLPPGL